MSEYLSNIWRAVLVEMENHLSKPSIETWLKNTRPVSLQENTFIVEVPNDFTRNWLKNHYYSELTSSLQKVINANCDIHFVVKQDALFNRQADNRPSQEVNREEDYKNTRKDFSSVCKWLNPKYTFDSFVIGSNNRFAQAACLAVAETPSHAYNPLFIYGGVGLGKTHLLHAIGHYVFSHNISQNVVYLSSEKFTNQFINAIRDNKTVDFRNKYRNIDVLLIDDIQFLAGKEQTQEEFFHTFNALHENNKQIVISSDRPPKEIIKLEDRLRSRFEWGLITDIQPPDLETRIAILRKKSQNEGIYIPDEILTFIAQKIETNIRELEGALVRIIAYASLEDRQISLEFATEALKDLLSKNKKNNITNEHIINATASYFKISPQDLKSRRRPQNIALPRQIAMYLCREITDCSLLKIGEDFGGKDHSTVIHAHRKISSDLAQNEELSQTVKEIKNLIYSI